jgi:two-component system chemotaxis response regulator CheB
VVAVVLSGTLDDGTAGMWAVKTCGGVAVVQDPADALFPGMPVAAMRNVDVDHCLPVAEIGPLLAKLAREPIDGVAQPQIPESVKIETEFMTMERDIDDMKLLGTPSAFTCPSCGGALWELRDEHVLRYRCHVGHAYAADSLLASQSETIEQALYSALRALEEKTTALRRLAVRFSQRHPNLESNYLAQATQADAQADSIRRLLAGRSVL